MDMNALRIFAPWSIGACWKQSIIDAPTAAIYSPMYGGTLMYLKPLSTASVTITASASRDLT